MDITIETEKMSGEFIKHHLRGLPLDAVMHHFNAPDTGSPHSHPYNFTSHIISGGYIERVYTLLPNGRWRSKLIKRLPDTVIKF